MTMVKTTQERIEHEIGQDGRLTLRGVSGDVHVTASAGTSAVVVARIQGNAKLNVEKKDGALVVEQVQRGMLGGIFERESIDFEVSLPAAAFAEVNTVSGDIDAAGLTGEQTFSTVSGDVVLHDTAGRVSLNAVSGDLDLTASGPIEVSANTTSGDIDIAAARIERLTARSVSGDIEVIGALAAGPRHTIETVSGDFSLESLGGATVELSKAMDLGRESHPVVVGDGMARVVFRTMSGDHRVRGGNGTVPSAGRQRQESVPTSRSAEARMEILQALERGEIDVDEATRRLEEMSNG
jgi:DUF4097 and DUF4098 domain-containing protein YvlB